MASTYSALKIELMATGENDTTWGDITNDNIEALGEAIAGSADITFASSDITLTFSDSNAAQNARHLRLRCTGTSGGARNLVVPTMEKPYLVKNDCADAVTVKTSAGTGIAVPAGKTMWLYVDGTNVVDAITHLSSLTVAGNAAVTGTLAITGASTLTGAVTASSTVTTADNVNAVVASGQSKGLISSDGTREVRLSPSSGGSATPFVGTFTGHDFQLVRNQIVIAALSASGIDVTGEVRADSLRIDVVPTAETITCTHTLTISANGTDYKIPMRAA